MTRKVWPEWIENVFRDPASQLLEDNDGDWPEACNAAWLAIQDLKRAGYDVVRTTDLRA